MSKNKTPGEPFRLSGALPSEVLAVYRAVLTQIWHRSLVWNGCVLAV
jgi:hypothetical protein